MDDPSCPHDNLDLIRTGPATAWQAWYVIKGHEGRPFATMALHANDSDWEYTHTPDLHFECNRCGARFEPIPDPDNADVYRPRFPGDDA